MPERTSGRTSRGRAGTRRRSSSTTTSRPRSCRRDCRSSRHPGRSEAPRAGRLVSLTQSEEEAPLNALAGHTNSYHTYGFEDALRGIANAGFRYVELTAVPGWTEHVDLSTDPAEVRGLLEGYGLEAVSLSAHSDLTTREGLEHGIRGIRWAAEYGLPIVNTAVGGHESADENEQAFLANVGALADAAEEAGVAVGLEIHGDIMASSDVTLPLLEKIGRSSINVNYDTANVEYYSGEKAVDDLPKIASELVNVHLKDTTGGKGNWNFPAIGSGSVDFARVREILHASGYSGPLAVELEFQGEPWPPLEEVDEAMRKSYEHLRSVGY